MFSNVTLVEKSSTGLFEALCKEEKKKDVEVIEINCDLQLK
jgi:hypothetical protein